VRAGIKVLEIFTGCSTNVMGVYSKGSTFMVKKNNLNPLCITIFKKTLFANHQIFILFIPSNLFHSFSSAATLVAADYADSCLLLLLLLLGGKFLDLDYCCSGTLSSLPMCLHILRQRRAISSHNISHCHPILSLHLVCCCRYYRCFCHYHRFCCRRRCCCCCQQKFEVSPKSRARSHVEPADQGRYKGKEGR
jgi:hypothetical protein